VPGSLGQAWVIVESGLYWPGVGSHDRNRLHRGEVAESLGSEVELMRVLVTGGAGFIGSHLADRLVLLDHQVLVVDDLSTGHTAHVPPEARLEVLDLGDVGRLQALYRSFDPQVVFHFAAQVSVGQSIADPLRDAERNVMASLRLLDMARANRAYMVFASSGGAIYGEAEAGPQGENHPERPLSPYGAAKLAVDAYLGAYRHQYGMGTCSLRFSNVYGPRQGQGGEGAVVPSFCEAALQGEPLRICGSGEQTRDFLFVGDVAELVPLILAHRPLGVLNLGTGRETSVLDLAREVMRLAGVAESWEHVPGRIGEQRRSVLDASQAQEKLGWRAATELKEGLAATLAWARG
jgi:UDP-glucose 4-epimerase